MEKFEGQKEPKETAKTEETLKGQDSLGEELKVSSDRSNLAD